MGIRDKIIEDIISLKKEEILLKYKSELKIYKLVLDFLDLPYLIKSKNKLKNKIKKS